MDQNVSIIFGGTGFIGSTLARNLVNRGEKVISISRHIPQEKEFGVEYFAFDIENETEGIIEACKEGSTFFLLIGQIYQNFDTERERAIFRKLLNIVKRVSPKKVIFASSVLVYGDCKNPINEDGLLGPMDEYSVFKVECEEMIQAELPEISVGIARLSNVYGSEKNRGVIGLIFRKVLDGSEMCVNGDGLQERDYIFVDDVANALIALCDGTHGFDIVNVATGHSSTILDVIHLAGAAIGKEISYQATGIPIDEVAVSRIDVAKLRNQYGFEAKISLETGLQKTWERYQLHI